MPPKKKARVLLGDAGEGLSEARPGQLVWYVLGSEAVPAVVLYEVLPRDPAVFEPMNGRTYAIRELRPTPCDEDSHDALVTQLFDFAPAYAALLQKSRLRTGTAYRAKSKAEGLEVLLALRMMVRGKDKLPWSKPDQLIFAIAEERDFVSHYASTLVSQDSFAAEILRDEGAEFRLGPVPRKAVGRQRLHVVFHPDTEDNEWKNSIACSDSNEYEQNRLSRVEPGGTRVGDSVGGEEASTSSAGLSEASSSTASSDSPLSPPTDSAFLSTTGLARHSIHHSKVRPLVMGGRVEPGGTRVGDSVGGEEASTSSAGLSEASSSTASSDSPLSPPTDSAFLSTTGLARHSIHHSKVRPLVMGGRVEPGGTRVGDSVGGEEASTSSAGLSEASSSTASSDSPLSPPTDSAFLSTTGLARHSIHHSKVSPASTPRSEDNVTKRKRRKATPHPARSHSALDDDPDDPDRDTAPTPRLQLNF